jgi:hypothetical protein
VFSIVVVRFVVPALTPLPLCRVFIGSPSSSKMATMDVEQLHIVLQQSFSPDIHLRGPAEETIRNLKQIKGATTLLLQIAAEKQVSEILSRC